MLEKEDVSSQAVKQFLKFAFSISINLVREQGGIKNLDNLLVMAQYVCINYHYPPSSMGVTWSGLNGCCTRRSGHSQETLSLGEAKSYNGCWQTCPSFYPEKD